jgi:hypothetical protein
MGGGPCSPEPDSLRRARSRRGWAHAAGLCRLPGKLDNRAPAPQSVSDKGITAMSVTSRVLAAAVLLLVIAGCSPTSGQTSKGKSTPTPSTPATPVPPPLGPISTNCPISAAQPQPVFPQQLAPVIGTSPVWATWAPGPNTFHLLPPPQYPPSYLPPSGWPMTKTIWEVGPNYWQPVTVQGRNSVDGAQLMFTFTGTTPVVANAVLDPAHPGHGGSALGDGWAEWGSTLIVPEAGCYTLTVSWPTGHWLVTFAAGA